MSKLSLESNTVGQHRKVSTNLVISVEEGFIKIRPPKNVLQDLNDGRIQKRWETFPEFDFSFVSVHYFLTFLLLTVLETWPNDSARNK